MASPAPKPTIKIFGERNTGTNYLAQLLVRNLDVHLLPGVVPRRIARLSSRANRVGRAFGIRQMPPGERIKDLWFASSFRTNLGWKHMLVTVDELSKQKAAAQPSFVTLSKNPYSWALSMFKRPYHQGATRQPSIEEFLGTPWRTVGRERAPAYFPSPIHMWNEKNRAYLMLASTHRAINVRYESLLQSPAGIVDQVSSISGAQNVGHSFGNIDESTKGEADKGYSYYRQYYLDEAWRDLLSAQSLAIINDALNREVADSLGYPRIENP